MSRLTAVLPSGDVLERDRDAAILRFTGRRKTLSTAALGGGLRADLTAAFNRNDCPQAGKYCEMQGDTMAEHQAAAARALGLEPARVTGLHTGANIDNTAQVTLTHADFAVTAIVTAGVEVNACRVGAPADLHETDGKAVYIPGTVNILLAVNAALSDGCLTRALVTCTEAKVAAMQELLVSDRYGRGLATGSGTDGTILIANSESPVRLTEAGERFRLGEYIGRAVSDAVKEALYRQSGLCAGLQHSVFRRLERFGVTPTACWERYRQACPSPVSRADFDHMMADMTADGSIVTTASLYAHLIDQALWGLLLPREAADAGDRLLAMSNAHHGMPDSPGIRFEAEPARLADAMADAFLNMIVHWVIGSV